MRKWLLSVITLFLAACTTLDCPVDNTVETRYGILDSSGNTFSLTDTLWVYSYKIDGTETLLLNSLINASKFYLPISYSHPEDVLYFYQKNDSVQMLDTVWIKKEDYPHFESVDCSASFFHTITGIRYTTNGIDSIVINNRTVNYDSTTVHFHLYPKSSH